MRWRRQASYIARMTVRISSARGEGQSSISEPIVGRKMQTVGNAPMAVMRSIASMVFSIGSSPAMISPDTAPRRSFETQCSIALKKSGWPSVRALPGQMRENQYESSSSTQKEK